MTTILVLTSLLSFMLIVYRKTPVPTRYECVNMVTKCDTASITDSITRSLSYKIINLENLYKKQDSLYKDIKGQQENFHDEINLMVDKTSAWTGFWITLLAIIICIPTIYQFIQLNKLEDKIKEGKSESNDFIKKYLDFYKKQYSELSDKIKKEKDELSKYIIENQISTLVMYFCNLSSPEIIEKNENRLQKSKNNLKLLNDLFTDYIKIIKETQQDDITQYRYSTNMIINQLILALTHAQLISNTLSNNLEFYELKDSLIEFSENPNFYNKDEITQQLIEIQYKFWKLINYLNCN